MQKIVKTDAGYRVEGRQTYEDKFGVEHTITWMRMISEKEIPELARRIYNENLDEDKKARAKKLRLSLRKKRLIR